MIPYNKPFLTGLEETYFATALKNRKFSGDGPFTLEAQNSLMKLHNDLPSKILLTTSCTDALEMAALLLDIKEGDEVIMPSYTFVSTALAFIMRGATIKFADSEPDRPHVSYESIKSLISPRTKAVVPVNYGGSGHRLGAISSLCDTNNIAMIEDNAQGLNSKIQWIYGSSPLGTFGCMSTLSFHESKNVQCGEGGALIINDSKYVARAEILREKGTNRSSFFRGEVNKYGWSDLGSSYLMSDILASFLCAQLEDIKRIAVVRKRIYKQYSMELTYLANFGLTLPCHSWETNAHIFYLVCTSLEQRTSYIEFMKQSGVMCTSHYLSLHKSDYFKDKYSGPELVNSDRFTDCLVRLPLYPELKEEEAMYIINKTKEFFSSREIR